MKISACLITYNEQKNILDAIECLDFADEIVIVDSGSADNTRTIAREFGAKVIEQEWLGFGKQKQFAVKKCSFDWVFCLDADERVSKELRQQILAIKNANLSIIHGYKFSRLSFYMGKAIKHGGWYPDWQLRLFDRKRGAWKDVPIHESVEMDEDSEVRKVKADILHYSVENSAHHHKMIGERYAPLAALKMFESGRTTNKFRILTASFVAFVNTYFLKLGVLDGLPGYAISRFAAHHAYLKHLMLWEMQNKNISGR